MWIELPRHVAKERSLTEQRVMEMMAAGDFGKTPAMQEIIELTGSGDCAFDLTVARWVKENIKGEYELVAKGKTVDHGGGMLSGTKVVVVQFANDEDATLFKMFWL